MRVINPHRNRRTAVVVFTVLSAALAMQGCVFINHDCVTGSGIPKTEERNLSGYTRIHLTCACNVTLKQGPLLPVTITADDNVMPYVECQVVDGVLRLGTRQCIQRHSPFRIEVQCPAIEGIAISGSGDIVCPAPLAGDKLHLSITGSGNISAPLAVRELRARISGSGDMRLTGTAEKFAIDITGSGDVDGRELQCVAVAAKITGSGDCRVRVRDEIKARISGSGDLAYRGDPGTVRVTTSGSGRAHRIAP